MVRIYIYTRTYNKRCEAKQYFSLSTGMEARITRLEKELRAKIGFKGEEEEDAGEDSSGHLKQPTDLVHKADELEDLKQDELQGDETSSDGGIESGTDDLSEK